jgi:alpha-mannosidase
MFCEEPKMNLSCTVAAVLAASVFLLPGLACGQSMPVWEIGKPDQSIHEFRATPSAHIDYQADKNNWAQDWPGEQRSGSLYEIRFDLGTAPRGVFYLRISALTSFPRTPALRIQMNGHTELYYLHPKPLYLADQRFRAADVLTVEFPAEYLKESGNRLTLTPVSGRYSDEIAAEVPETVAYDFLSLSCDPHAKYERLNIAATVVPTIFYYRRDGNIVERIDAFLRFNRAVPEGRASLLLNGARFTTDIARAGEAGEERLRFEVPEWHGTAPAKLQIEVGQRRTFRLTLAPERKWNIYVVPHTHVDIGYTDYQGKVAEAQANTLVEAADFIAQHPDFRFSTDGSWNLRQLLETRSQSRRDQVLALIRQDKIAVPADYFNLLTGYASLETLYRSLYYSKNLSRTFGLPFTYATTTDVPSYTGAYPSVLAGAGVRYWAVGGNQDRATVLAHEQWDERSPFWWEGPDGAKVLFWYSRGYAQIGAIFGVNPQDESISEALPIFLAAYDKPEYKPDAVMMYGAQAENTDLHPDLATFVGAWNQSFAWPTLRYATFPDFFRYIDENYGSMLATYKGDMGPYWEDGIGSDAYYAAKDRQNQSEALSSEIVSTVAHLIDPDAHPPRRQLVDAWNNILLFAEHTWGADRSISEPDSEESVRQLAVKDNSAIQAGFDLEDVESRSMGQLARKIQIPSGTLVVMNPLNWKQDALVEADLGRNEQLVDMTTRQQVPVQVLSDRENFLHVRFLAENLPPVGYKCFEIRRVSGLSDAQAAVQSSPVIENQYYRVTVDPESGAVRSIFDKLLQREVVDLSSPYRFGQYLYVTGGDPQGDGMTRMIHPFVALPVAELTVHPAANGRYLGTEKTPFGDSMRLSFSDVNTPDADLEILLYDNEKKIEFRYTIQKTYTTSKEAVYFAFPTSVKSPQFAYATQQGWVDPARDLLKGAGLEWFSVQKWMAVHDSGLTVGIVPLDASLASFGDINRGLWPAEFHPKSSTLFSYVMNNYWHTNYRAGQGGTFRLRYVLTSTENFDPPGLSRLGWKNMEPPVVDEVIKQDKVGNPNEPWPPEGTSFLTIDNPNIVLVTWKLAEDGKGTILRMKETAGRQEEAEIRLAHTKVESAMLCNSVEDDLRRLEVRDDGVHVTFRPNGVLTIRLIP